MFRKRGFIFRKTVVYTGMVQGVLYAEITIKTFIRYLSINIFYFRHVLLAEITIQGFYKISKYKIYFISDTFLT